MDSEEKNRSGFYVWFTKFLACVVLLLALPIFIIVVIAEGLYLPIDFIIYSFSGFKRETGIGYSFYISGKTVVKLYKAVKKNSLPLEFVSDGKSGGSFVFRDKLLICDAPAIHYDEDLGGLCLHSDHKESEECRYVSLQDYISERIEAHNTVNPEKACTLAVIIAKKAEIEPEALSYAKAVPALTVYKGRGELLAAVSSVIAE